jgi:hypothetical protein
VNQRFIAGAAGVVLGVAALAAPANASTNNGGGLTRADRRAGAEAYFTAPVDHQTGFHYYRTLTNPDGSSAGFKSEECFDGLEVLGTNSTNVIPPVGGVVDWQCFQRTVKIIPGVIDAGSGDQLAYGEMYFEAQLDPAYTTFPATPQVTKGEFCNWSRFPSAFSRDTRAVITPTGHVSGWCAITKKEMLALDPGVPVP